MRPQDRGGHLAGDGATGARRSQHHASPGPTARRLAPDRDEINQRTFLLRYYREADLHQFRKRGSRRITRERGRLMASRKRLGGDVLPEPTRRANNQDLHRPFPFAQPPCLGSRRRHALLLRLPVSVHTQRSREGLADRMRVAAFRRTGDTRPSRKGFSSAGRVSQPRASRGPPTLHGARSCSSLSATPRRHRRRTTAASVPRMG